MCVYPRAPGTVVRCPTCHAVVMVLVTIGDECHVDVPALQFEEYVFGTWLRSCDLGRNRRQNQSRDSREPGARGSGSGARQPFTTDRARPSSAASNRR
ncbi:MAG: DUF6510 family protein [Solirubrobacteraceae bacterium]